MEFLRSLFPNREMFAADPFGYSASALDKWRLLQNINGFSRNMEQPPSREELNSPILWLCQARALTEAAAAVIKKEPDFHLPDGLHSICDSQYCATGIMLVGYSLEICLKGMLVVKGGVNNYLASEKDHQHHQLEKLADLIPNLSNKDIVTLKILSNFITWAGRYPAPKPNKESQREHIFKQAENYKITASNVFELSSRIMKHTTTIIENNL